MVMNTQTIRMVVGIIGNVISFGLFASPLPTFLRIIKNKSVEEFKPDPYLATTMNCLFWVLYGTPLIHPGSTLVLTTNGIGLAMELAYLFVFLLYAKDNKQRLYVGGIFLLELVVIGLVGGLVIGLVPTNKRRSLIIGIICMIFNIMMYASPFTIVRKVFKTKSVEYMPFLLSLANTLNGLCWLIYALLRFDINLLIPNSLGLLFGLVQLGLYGHYYKRTPKSGDDKKQAKAEVQLQGADLV